MGLGVGGTGFYWTKFGIMLIGDRTHHIYNIKRYVVSYIYVRKSGMFARGQEYGALEQSERAIPMGSSLSVSQSVSQSISHYQCNVAALAPDRGQSPPQHESAMWK